MLIKTSKPAVVSLGVTEEQLKQAVPLMRCGNRTEFKQRLQWLSEGMLRNHLEHITNYTVDQQEIEQYKKFRSLK